MPEGKSDDLMEAAIRAVDNAREDFLLAKTSEKKALLRRVAISVVHGALLAERESNARLTESSRPLSMTNERHEKALEAAEKAVILKMNGFQWYEPKNNYREAVGAGIAAYLEAMDAVIVPREPTEEMLDAGEIYVPFGRLAEHRYRAMISKAPKHFTNGE